MMQSNGLAAESNRKTRKTRIGPIATHAATTGAAIEFARGVLFAGSDLLVHRTTGHLSLRRGAAAASVKSSCARFGKSDSFDAV